MSTPHDEPLGAWIVPDAVFVCRYPHDEQDLHALRALRIRLLINFHSRPHQAGFHAARGLHELHLPVPDFTAPGPEQIEQGITAINQAVADGDRVSIHCGTGLGRSGTLAACWLVTTGKNPEAAIAEVRKRRPGAIETAEQEQAVRDWPNQTHHKN